MPSLQKALKIMRMNSQWIALLVGCLAAVLPRGAEAVSIVIDNPDAVTTGTWVGSSSTAGFHGSNYLHNNQSSGSTATYTPNLPTAGVWDVWASWTSSGNRHAAVPYTINHLGGPTVETINQKVNGGWNLLGSYNFSAGNSHNVVISAPDSSGFVIADAVAFSNTTANTSHIDPSGFTATASSSIGSEGRTPAKAIDGTGMVDVPIQYHQGTNNGNNVNWLSGVNDTDGWFKVDLGQTYNLDTMNVWNFSQDNGSQRGVQTADIYISTLDSPHLNDFSGSGDWTLVGDDVTFANAGSTAINDTFDVFDFGASPVAARWVVFDIQNNYGDPYVGLGEVRFFAADLAAVPEPGTLGLLALALSSLFLRRVRRV